MRLLQRFGLPRSTIAIPYLGFLASVTLSSVSALSCSPPRLSSATSRPSADAAASPSRILGRRGFILRTVARLHRPRVFSRIRGSATLCSLTAKVSPFTTRFYGALGTIRLQSSSASRGKARSLLVSRPASVCFGACPDFGARSVTTARPPLHTHLAGSLFATYTSSASCFLQTHHLW